MFDLCLELFLSLMQCKKIQHKAATFKVAPAAISRGQEVEKYIITLVIEN